jgi:hypothetical protein
MIVLFRNCFNDKSIFFTNKPISRQDVEKLDFQDEKLKNLFVQISENGLPLSIAESLS